MEGFVSIERMCENMERRGVYVYIVCEYRCRLYVFIIDREWECLLLIGSGCVC